MADKMNHGGRRMWWWSSLEAAERWGDWANVALVAALAVGVVATYLIVSTTNVKEHHWREFRQQSDERIAEQTRKAREAELKLEQLRRTAAPRSLNSDIFAETLKGAPKAHAQIWYLPDTSDGLSFSSEIFFGFLKAGWNVDLPSPIPDVDPTNESARNMPRALVAGGQPSGISVVASSMKDSSAGALVDALLKSTVSMGISLFMPVPTGTVRVVIAAKPDPRLPPAKSAEPQK